MSTLIFRTTFILILLASWAVAADNATHITIAGRDVAVWKPTGAAPERGYPLIVFSHGFGGCNTQSTFLMDALAHAGYVVVAPNHADARCSSAHGDMSKRSRPDEPFRSPNEWSDTTYRNRREDIEAVLDWVLGPEKFDGVVVNHKQVGIAGHSLGDTRRLDPVERGHRGGTGESRRFWRYRHSAHPTRRREISSILVFL